MNRVIKFRVWSDIRKEWITNMSLIAAGDGLPFAHFVETGADKNFIKHHIYNLSEAEPTLQQFTGLADKNGKEIYEGDIVEFTQHSFNTPEEKFRRKRKEIKWLNYPGAWNLYETNAGESDIEVIGNIFENPELLK